MIHSYKNLVCAALVGASFVACCFQPIQAKAIDISVGEQAGIYDYLDAGHTALFTIDFQFDEDSDGNRSKRLQIYGLQSAMLNTQTQIYDNMDFSLAPSSVSVSGSGASGVFYDNNHNLHGGTVLQGSSLTGNLFTSDLFNITYGFYANQSDLLDSSLYTCSPYVYNSGISGQIGVQCRKNGGGSFYPYRRTFATSTYLTTLSASFYNGSVSLATIAVPRYLDNSFPPTILPSTNVCGICAGSVYEGASGYSKLLGYSVNVMLPSSSTDTRTPWDYYNNVLVPYMREQFPDVTNIEQYFIFPDGYVEPEQPTTIPIVYPTAPGFDFGLIEDGTEPEGIETAAFELPQIETKSIGIPVFDFDSLNPAEIVAPVSNGVSGIWALITDVLQSFGLFPLVTLSLLVAVIGAILLLGR